MIPQTMVAVLIGVGIGCYLYYMSMTQEQESGYTHGYHNRRRSTPPTSDSQNSRSNSGNSTDARRTTTAPGNSRNRKSANTGDCTICLEPLLNSPVIPWPICSHKFHENCILSWKINGPHDVRDKCPLCRGKV